MIMKFLRCRSLRLNPDIPSSGGGSGGFVHLGEAPEGSRVRVTGFDLPEAKSRRLLEMGFVPGTILEVVRFAPLGDPIEVCVRGYHLSLRRAEARGVRVESWQ